jgi:hypothetical protein
MGSASKAKKADVLEKLFFLALLLIALSLDVEKNPGPVQTLEHLEGNYCFPLWNM